MTEMTRREFFEAVANCEGIDSELKLFAEKEIEKMDARNAKRRANPSKKAVENEPIKDAIRKVLTDEPQSAKEIAEKVEISTQKASALLRQMDVTVSEIKVKGKGKVKGYSVEQKKKLKKGLTNANPFGII